MNVNTKQFKRICKRAEKWGATQGPNEAFWKLIDPMGFHVLKAAPHGSSVGVVRTIALCKVKGTKQPEMLIVDVLAKDWDDSYSVV